MTVNNPPAVANIWQPADQGLIAWAYDPANPSAATAMPASGTLVTIALKLNAGASITNVIVNSNVAGSVLTAGQCFAGVYQGTTLLGSTADQSAAWAGGTGAFIMPLVGGPFQAAAGVIRVALLFNGTTGPSFTRQSSVAAMGNINLAAGVSRWSTANAGQTTLPATLGALTLFSTTYWAAVS